MSIYAEFASEHIDDFMERLATEWADSPNEPREFGESHIRKYVRYLEGCSDFYIDYGSQNVTDLARNPRLIAKALLKYVDSDWQSKEYYTDICPDLIEKTKLSLEKISKNI
jgi:hypothetical protein